ncbi:D-arabinose 5-phosphate isomerase [Armatimonadota bacterium]|nr:D-arabinose 5-phosphate isomerase [Armatimonadota bacterium]
MTTTERTKTNDALWMETAQETLSVASDAIRRVSERLTPNFLKALEILDDCAGKVITSGVGKSGIVARKIAATLTSTGCPSVFLHPSEAMHGDLGIVEPDDVVIALSNSGESEELLAILPALLARRVPLIAIVGNLQSTLARRAAVVIDSAIEREACPLNLAPTTSVIVQLALGDALAMTLHSKRGFGTEDYARNHPGGRLGRRLTLCVRDILAMNALPIPIVAPSASMMDALAEISAKCVGATIVANADRKILGILTDYDTRQAFQKFGADALKLTAEQIMNPHPKVILHPDQLAYEALRQMEDGSRQISVAPVVDSESVCVGMVRIHDFLRAGL